MIDPRQIHDFLDGTSSPEAETMLFSLLASDAEGRRELAEQINLHLAVKKDLAATVVPADAEAAIFRELGYSGAVDVAPAPATTGRRSRLVLPLLLLLFLSSGVIATRWFWPRVVVAGQGREFSASQQTAPSHVAPDHPTGDPAPEVRGSSLNGQIASVDVADVERDGYDLVELDHDASVALSPVEALPFRSVQPAIETSEGPQHLARQIHHNTTTPLSPWRLAVQGLTTLSSTPALEDAAPSTEWTQFTAGVSYDVTDDLRLSLVGGRQRVHQEFTRFENGRDVSYTQSPLLWWLGASATQDVPQLALGDVLTPFASATIGWMQTGPMGRLSAGIHLFPQQRLSFDLSLDGMATMYPIQGTYFTSTNLAVSYGVTLRF